MKNIILMCNMGMSTSMMVAKMKEEAEKQGYECKIAAYSLNSLKEVSKEADCILLGPQMRFQVDTVKEKCPDIPVTDIDMMNYGMMNGKAVLEMARKLMKDE